MARRASISGSIEVSNIQVEDAASSATLSILSAVTGKIPQIHGVVIATDTAGTYALKIGSTTKLKVYLAANSGYAEKFHPFYLTNSTANEAVTLTKPSGANTSVTLFYTNEPALS